MEGEIIGWRRNKVNSLLIRPLYWFSKGICKAGQNESFHSGNTKAPRGSAAVPKPKCLLFYGQVPWSIYSVLERNSSVGPFSYVEHRPSKHLMFEGKKCLTGLFFLLAKLLAKQKLSLTILNSFLFKNLSGPWPVNSVS